MTPTRRRRFAIRLESWDGVREEEGGEREHRQRAAHRNDDARSVRRSLLDEHHERENAHPRQVRDAGRKHHEHQSPAAAETEECVAQSDAQAVESAALVVPGEVHAGMAARPQARVLQRRQLIDGGEPERRRGDPRCVRRKPRTRIDRSVQPRVAGKCEQRERRPDAEVRQQEQAERRRILGRVARRRGVHPDEAERRRQHHRRRHHLPCSEKQ